MVLCVIIIEQRSR